MREVRRGRARDPRFSAQARVTRPARSKRWPALLLAFAAAAAAAQPPESANGGLLVAKPGLPDPGFSETAGLVTQTPDARTGGVILNRPLPVKLPQTIPDDSLNRAPRISAPLRQHLRPVPGRRHPAGCASGVPRPGIPPGSAARGAGAQRRPRRRDHQPPDAALPRQPVPGARALEESGRARLLRRALLSRRPGGARGGGTTP